MNTEETIQLLKELIRRPSQSGEESATADLLEHFLSEHGVRPRRLHNNVYAFAEGYDPARETLMLNSHHDTVRPSASYTRDPYSPDEEDGRIYTTYDTTVITPQDYKINPLAFAVSPDGKYVVMAGTVANALDYRIYVYNTETGASVTYTETNYAQHGNMRFLDDTTVMFYVINVDGYENVVLDLSAIR